ncbi:dephospho-CoA kinase [Polynucleobacter sp. AP-Jannik-300A-C4]|uniref:dephospho-CoA kinase n=1 Tax=Polynucleobacter sp. AP-Jannik-300A-C4 TaxID=2576928 RepID=UPI001BFEDEC0|nr:dephospho-CoA kinase [Polynucleobacter sp. AP-Jannik-300A-C4]QWE23593.1 dephospho-CoA kinase [Polynucleobacter sp. AP-Jannik-300A-C4]
MPCIGLTGGIGSGKTAVSDLLDKLGAGVIDTDLISHQITAPGGKAIPLITKEFGADFIDPQGALDRPKMRALVFADSNARQALEKITHPLIQQETAKQAFELAKSGAPYLVFVVPLLIESGSWVNLIDYLIVVDCPEETQIQRVMHRSNMTRLDVESILKAQTSRKVRLAAANAVIENQGSLDELKSEVLRLHQELLKI